MSSLQILGTMEKLRKFGRILLSKFKPKEENIDFSFVTDIKEEKCSIVWRIENIHRCRLKCGEFIESPVFSTIFCSEDKWTLKIYPRGSNSLQKRCPDHSSGGSARTDCDIVALFINRISTNPVTSSFAYRFVIKRDLLNSSSKQMSFHFLPEERVYVEMDLKSSSEFGTDNLCCAESLRPPQTLLVKCEIMVANTYNKGAAGNYVPGLLKSCSLSQDLKEMYKSGKFSDVTLQAKGEQFPAHKNILASRSEVFDAMFKHNMKETQTNIVEIEDVEPTVLSYLLQYIYTGSVDDFDVEKAILMCSVADRYLLEELKKWCVDMMLINLTVENVCRVAVLAELHPDPNLQKATFNMFRNYTREIFKRKEWQNLVQDTDRRGLVSSILQAVSADFTTNIPKELN